MFCFDVVKLLRWDVKIFVDNYCARIFQPAKYRKRPTNYKSLFNNFKLIDQNNLSGTKSKI